MEAMYFDSEEAMINYVKDENYELNGNQGLCAGISYSGDEKTNNTLKFHFDDQNQINYTT